MDTKKSKAAIQSTLIHLLPEEKDKRVLLKVTSRENEAEQYYYWIGRNTPFRELMTDYTQRIGVSINSVRFLFNRSHIDPSISANSLKLEDGDSIVVNQRYKYMMGTESTLITLDRDIEDIEVFVKVKGVGNDPSFVYSVGGNTPMRHLMLDYCDRAGSFFEFTKFSFRGSIIGSSKFADDFKLYDSIAIIDVVTS